ncbi:MAG: glucose 1-dehydrogenase [Dehalococcoidia bacterium]|nr:MAG: glucose 1-dehydrogenase [Dehalococcoidia bacterium]
MLAVGIVKGKEGVHSLDLPKPEIQQPDEVLVRIRQVGLDGTDFSIIRHQLHDIAEGRDSMAMGHEMVGAVEEVGSAVKGVAPGDLVTMTVRRGCGQCHPCLHNQSDMCMTGLYTERGIHKLDGYLTEYAVDQEQYIVKVPPELMELEVFTEPLSIAEKGIEQIRIIQSRLPWTCPHPEHAFTSESWGTCLNALVVGAGPLGLLTTALLRLHEVNTYVSDIVPEENIKAHMVRHLGATYVNARDRTAKEVLDACSIAGGLNIVFEASGAADMALQLINHLSRSSIYVMTGIPREGLLMQIDAAQIVAELVRKNQVIVGSVNSNRTHFEMALRDIGPINSRFDGMLQEMITHRHPLSDFQQAFSDPDAKHIKTVIDIEP